MVRTEQAPNTSLWQVLAKTVMNFRIPWKQEFHDKQNTNCSRSNIYFGTYKKYVKIPYPNVTPFVLHITIASYHNNVCIYTCSRTSWFRLTADISSHYCLETSSVLFLYTPGFGGHIQTWGRTRVSTDAAWYKTKHNFTELFLQKKLITTT